MIAARRLWAVWAVLVAAACSSGPDAYTPPIPRQPFGPEPHPKARVVNMSDPDAEGYFVRDISKTLEAGVWRWAAKRPELKIYLGSVTGLKFTIDFALPEPTFSRTGPVTLSFLINGHLLDRVLYSQPGGRHFEKPVPESLLKSRAVNYIVVEPDKVWTSPNGVTYGFVLTRAGFAAL